MKRDRLKYLLDCYRLKKCSESELSELNAWYHALNHGSKDMDDWLSETGGEQKLTDQAFIDFKQHIKTPVKINYHRIAVAAALIVMASAGYFLLNSRGKDVSIRIYQPSHAKMDIAPGGNKATLILSDGKAIVLTSAKLGKLATQGNTLVNQHADSSISYNSAHRSFEGREVQYNTLITPRGGKYTLTLSDGTEVTLDAASSIKFPVAFNGTERRVIMSGQAYFKVMHNAKSPFYVVTKGHVIKDLGTEFNVNSYEDEPNLKVTLAEGLVQVSNSRSNASLIPGQQALVNNYQQDIAVREVNVGDVVAWKNGWFVFRNESIINVLKQAGRWYDVDIQYEGKAITKKFGGSISKYKNISELLENLKITGGINYRIEGRRVTLIN